MSPSAGPRAASPLQVAVAVVRPIRPLGHQPTVEAWGSVLVEGLRRVTGVTAGELAEAAGCGVDLVAAIESGRIRPAWETLERLANSVGLEIRVGVRRCTDIAGVSARLDPDFDRVREALDTENAWRAGLGLGPLGPPAATVPPWDGTDPAPARQVSAWPHRTDFGGHTAINVRYGRNCVLGVDETAFAASVELTTAELRNIEAGHVTLSLDDTERLLNRAGLEQFAHLEPYDAHDDLLHLDAIAKRSRTRRLAHVGSR